MPILTLMKLGRKEVCSPGLWDKIFRLYSGSQLFQMICGKVGKLPQGEKHIRLFKLTAFGEALMPIHSEILKSRKLIVTKVEGFLTLKEFTRKQKLLSEDPEFDPGHDHLFDMSGVTGVEDITASMLKDISSVRIFSESSRRAVVAPGDLEFGLSRMYEVFSHSTDDNFSVFRNVEDALAWLERRQDI